MRWSRKSDILFFFKKSPFSRKFFCVSYISKNAGMFIPFFPVGGFASSSSSELDSSELDSSFFAGGGFLAGAAEISQWDDHEKVIFLFFKNSAFLRKLCHQW